jgi:hypothetical protein
VDGGSQKRIENPKITLKGKTYTAPPPKVKLWREVTKFKDKFGDKEQGDEEALSEMECLIAAAFNHPEISAEVIEETERRRQKQMEYNRLHNITPESIKKAVYQAIEATIEEESGEYDIKNFTAMSKEERIRLAGEMQKDMISAAEKLDFERAAELRDMIKQLLEGPQKGRSKKRR